jgi:hypothetical protein
MPKGIYKRVKPSYWKGKHQLEKTKEKISFALKNRHISPKTEIKKGMTGEKCPSWKGDKVTYKGLHRWLEMHFNKPKKCQKCGKQTKLDWANITRIYKRDIKNYMALCRKCHIRFDKANK